MYRLRPFATALLALCLALVVATHVHGASDLCIGPVLHRLGLGRHAPAFRAAGVTRSNARHLQSHDLKELGLATVRERLLLLEALSNGETAMPVVPADVDNLSHQDFVFKVANYWTARQMGKLINFIVKFRYPHDANMTDYIEYTQMRECVLYYAEPTPELPMPVYWELVNNAIVKNLTSRFRVLGMSSQIQVQGESVRMYEPGDHGSIVTVGDIEPLNVPALFNNTPV